MPAIEISSLGKIYRGKKWTSVRALSELSLDVEQGEVFGFLGPNGAGKSTTIKIIVGLIRPSTGLARVMGTAASDPRSRALVGYLPENPAFYDYLTGEEYLRLVGSIYRMEVPRLAVAIETHLRRLDLWEARRRSIRSYSKGMVQRLGLAQALIHDPQICIFDEPMSGLDPVGRALVKQIILELKADGKCVFFSTHITADVEEICDRVGIICGGRLRCVEKVEDVRRQGIVGYQVLVRSADGAAEEMLSVDSAKLPAVLGELQSAGRTVVLVEPRRKSLEAFFLDVVQKAAPEGQG